MRSRVTILAAALLLACSSCSTSHRHGQLQPCASVWGRSSLPSDYAGCTGPGSKSAQAVDCPSGIGRFAAYRGQLYALAGQKILAGGPGVPAYNQMFAACYASQ